MHLLQRLFGDNYRPIEVEESNFIRDFTEAVDVKGTNLRTLVARANPEKPAPTLLFIDGIRYQLELWEYQLEECSQFANILALDLPGTGGSDTLRDRDYSTHNIASFLLYWLKTQPLGFGTPIYIVASGGSVSTALELAIRLGEQCLGCVLVSGFTNTEHKVYGSSPCTTDPTLDIVKISTSEHPLQKQMYLQGQTFQGRTMLRALSFHNKDNIILFDKLRKANQDMNTHRKFEEYVIGHKPINRKTAERIQVPVLLIEGEESDIADTSDIWLQWLPHSRLEQVPNAKTAVALEQPEIVSSLIKDFVTLRA